MKEELFTYIHQNSSQKVCGDIVADISSIFKGVMLHTILLDVDDNKVDNIDRLFERYFEDDLQKYDADMIRQLCKSLNDANTTENNQQLLELPLYIQTRFVVNMSEMSRKIIFTESNQQVAQDTFNAFFSDAHYRLLRSPLHSKSFVSKNVSSGVAKHMFVHAVVWIWSKSLSVVGTDEYDDVIINATPFIFNVTTDVNENGGQFSLQLAPVQAEWKNNRWQIKDGTVKGSQDNLISHSNLHQKTSKGERRSDFFFEKAIQENDVVFIRFETLEIEKDERYKNSRKLYIDKSDLPNKPYDMIGLVDSVTESTNAESNDVTININGRDLIKLIIEDGVYFYPQLFANGGMFANITKQEKLKRYDGQLKSLFVYSFKNVATTLKFIINALSNISITSDTLFDAYKNSKNFDGKIEDRRSAFYSEKELTESQSFDKKDDETKKIVEKIKQYLSKTPFDTSEIVIFQQLSTFIAQMIADKTVAEKSVSFNVGGAGFNNGTGIAAAAFAGWKNNSIYKGEFLITINQLPFEFKDTFVEDLFLMNGTGNSPFSQEVFEICSDIYYFLKKDSTAAISKKKTESTPAKGIWQIVSLVIDESVQQRRLVDSSIGNEHGSLINGIRKICQDPFINFFTDTYYDKFYFIARKQPFDKASILSVLNGTVNIDTTKNSYGNDYGSLIIDINEEDIMTESISYGDTAYSWYYIRPVNLLNGGANDMNFAYLKAVYFSRYADIFGSKPLDISTNYIDYNSILDKRLRESVGKYIRQGILDLKYMVDTHAYLPFTRKGSFTLNPDRRIKRANFVRRVSTGEIFYVDSVNNTLSVSNSDINRSTTIQVSRGMVEKYIRGVEVNGKMFSYFDIINTTVDEQIFNEVLSANGYNEKILAKWGVNDDVFDFFLKKQQFTNAQPNVRKI